MISVYFLQKRSINLHNRSGSKVWDQTEPINVNIFSHNYLSSFGSRREQENYIQFLSFCWMVGWLAGMGCCAAQIMSHFVALSTDAFFWSVYMITHHGVIFLIKIVYARREGYVKQVFHILHLVIVTPILSLWMASAIVWYIETGAVRCH